MKTFLSYAAKMYYERVLDVFQTRLITIDTNEKRKIHQSEIIMLKAIIVMITNFLKAQNEK